MKTLALLLCCAVTAGAGAQVAEAALPRPVPFQRGINVADWGPDAYRGDRLRRTLKRLKTRYHIDSVSFSVQWVQSSLTSNRMRPSYGTAPDANLERAIRIARSLKLKVVLRPYLDPLSGGWRGQLEPDSITRWFANYRKFILTYARLAREAGARGYVIGTELTSLAGYETQWRALVAAVRRQFKGFLTYQSNWGVELQLVRWWDAVDAISIAAYYPVATSSPYTVDQLVAGWYGNDPFSTGWYAEIKAAWDLFQRPVLFTEIGYRTVEGSAMRPWDVDYVAPFSEQAQIQAYEAALQVWYRVPWFRGFHWWYVPTRRLAGLRGADHRPTIATLQLVGSWYSIRPRF